jgi:hypothetical protein
MLRFNSPWLAQRRNRTRKKKVREADALKEMLSEYALGSLHSSKIRSTR